MSGDELEGPAALLAALEGAEPVSRPAWCGPCSAIGRRVAAERTRDGSQTGRCLACMTRERERRGKAHADELRAELDAKARRRPT
jgi:hypothetical protein